MSLFDEVQRAVSTGEMFERFYPGFDEYGAAEALVPDNIEMVFWHAVTLANANKVEEALPLFKRVFAADAAWATLVPRLPKSKLLPDDQKIIQRILSSAPSPKP